MEVISAFSLRRSRPPLEGFWVRADESNDMNWYQRSQPQGFRKTAFKQDEWSHYFGDYQRWVIDAYEVRLFKTATDKQITISLNVWSGHVGEMTFQEFWKYDVNQSSKANSAYSEMKKIAQEVVDNFTKGENFEAPSHLIASTLRTKLWDVDREALVKARSNIPFINYARQKATYEADWRSSLYGNRYPTGDSSGF